MKKVILLLVSAIILSFPINVQAQMGPNDYRIGESRRYSWDYADNRVPAAPLTHFEVQIDGGVRVNTQSTIIPPSSTAVAYSWPLPVLAVGNHTGVVYACNTDGCVASVELQWRIWGLLPNTPTNPRIIPNSQPITGSQALNVAQGYTLALTLETLKQPQAVYLVNNYDGEVYPDGTLPYGDVLDYLDRQAHILLANMRR